MTSPDTRPNALEIDLDALEANLTQIRNRIRPGIAIIASVKANAYGHGIVPVARRLAAAGVEVLATGSFADAVAMYDAGIPIVLGTDSGFVGVLIGVSTHVELELLVEAGLSPRDAIGAATLNAARMIGRERDLGSLEAGKFADMVILDANPLDDIRNVTKIYRTVKGGVLYEPGDPARPR